MANEDDIYRLSVEGDITELSSEIKKVMAELSSSTNTVAAEQLRAATVLEKERIAGVNKLKAIELSAIKAQELEAIRAADRIAVAQQRAALRGGPGGAGNTRSDSFMTSLLGAENATAAMSTKIRIVSAEFLKMATFSRTATLALNAFKGAATLVSGVAIGAAVLAIAGGLKKLGDKYAESRREAKKFREEQEKVNKELEKTAVTLGVPKTLMPSLAKLKDSEKMIEELARKGFVSAPGLQAAGEKYGGADRNKTAQNLVNAGYSEETAIAFAKLWEVTKGNIKELDRIAWVARMELKELNNRATSYGGVMGVAVSVSEPSKAGAATNNAILQARQKETDTAMKLSEAKYFSLEKLTVAAKDFQSAEKEAAKKIKEVKDTLFEGLTKQFASMFNKQSKKLSDFNKWVTEANSKDKWKYGVDKPADTFYEMNKAVADYANAYSAQKDEMLKRLDKLVSGDEQMYALWQQIEQY